MCIAQDDEPTADPDEGYDQALNQTVDPAHRATGWTQNTST